MIQRAETLADTRAMIEANRHNWPAASRRQMLNALDRLAKLLGKELADLPADESALLAVVDGQLNWRREGFKTSQAFRDFRGRLARAARETNKAGLLRFTPRTGWRPDWRALHDDMEAAIERGDEKPSARKALAHLAGYANARGLGPGDVDDTVLADLLALHARHKAVSEAAGLKPANYARKAIASARAWNRLAGEKPNKPWLTHMPATILAWPGRSETLNPPLSAYPAEFQSDVLAYLASLAGPVPQSVPDDPDDPLGPIPAELESFEAWETAGGDRVAMTDVHLPDEAASVSTTRHRKDKLQPATLANHRNWIRQTAGAVVRRGLKRSDELRGLRDICTYPAIHAGTVDFMNRQRAKPDGAARQKSASASQLADTMCGIAERWAGAPPGYVAEMRRKFRQATRTESCGQMSARRLELLRQFDEPSAVLAWFDRPRALFEQAEKRRKNGQPIRPSDIADVEVALICRILGILPVRRRSLGIIRCKGDAPSLQLRRHRSEKSWLVFQPEEVKNRRFLRAEIDGETQRMIRVYLEFWRPRYLAMHPDLADSDCLFPGSVHDADGDGHRDLGALGRIFAARMAAAGLQMTLHLARHVAGKIIVDWDIRHVGTVADLLGNSERTVRKFYLADRSAQASKTFREIVEIKQPVLAREWLD